MTDFKDLLKEHLKTSNVVPIRAPKLALLVTESGRLACMHHFDAPTVAVVNERNWLSVFCFECHTQIAEISVDVRPEGEPPGLRIAGLEYQEPQTPKGKPE